MILVHGRSDTSDLGLKNGPQLSTMRHKKVYSFSLVDYHTGYRTGSYKKILYYRGSIISPCFISLSKQAFSKHAFPSWMNQEKRVSTPLIRVYLLFKLGFLLHLSAKKRCQYLMPIKDIWICCVFFFYSFAQINGEKKKRAPDQYTVTNHTVLLSGLKGQKKTFLIFVWFIRAPPRRFYFKST